MVRRRIGCTRTNERTRRRKKKRPRQNVSRKCSRRPSEQISPPPGKALTLKARSPTRPASSTRRRKKHLLQRLQRTDRSHPTARGKHLAWPSTHTLLRKKLKHRYSTSLGGMPEKASGCRQRHRSNNGKRCTRGKRRRRAWRSGGARDGYIREQGSPRNIGTPECWKVRQDDAIQASLRSYLVGMLTGRVKPGGGRAQPQPLPAASWTIHGLFLPTPTVVQPRRPVVITTTEHPHRVDRSIPPTRKRYLHHATGELLLLYTGSQAHKT